MLTADTIQVLHLREEDCLLPAEADALAAELLKEDSYIHLVTTDTDVYKPDGSLLLRFRKARIPLPLVATAKRVFEKAANPTDNRGVAAGKNEQGEIRVVKKRRDGTLARNSEAQKVHSGVVGFFDRQGGRFPYCRMTAFNMQYGDEFQEALPFVQFVSEQFRELVPERWAAQNERIQRTQPDFVIPGTVFTTITVNRNWQTAVHQDAGDLKEGFGILSAIRSNNFEGCYLCFPRFRVAVDLRTADLLFADVHEWHGNTPIKAVGRRFYRISFVFYYRERMFECGSAAEELERAKNREIVSPNK